LRCSHRGTQIQKTSAIAIEKDDEPHGTDLQRRFDAAAG